VDPYLSRPVRLARAAGVITSWLVGATALCLGFTRVLPQFVVSLFLVLGVAPYIISIKLVEPWLMRSADLRSSREGPKA
jgi:hypothetical protein